MTTQKITATTFVLSWHKARAGRYHCLTYSGALNEWSPTGDYVAELYLGTWYLTHTTYGTGPDNPNQVRTVPGAFKTLRAAKQAAEDDREGNS